MKFIKVMFKMSVLECRLRKSGHWHDVSPDTLRKLFELECCS